MFVYGASGHGKVLFEIAQALGLPVAVFVDCIPPENSKQTKR
jgi:hypothetical protein